MKRFRWVFFLSAMALAPVLAQAQGYIDGKYTDLDAKYLKEDQRGDPLTPPPPTCVASSPRQKVRIVSWNPKQKVEKFLGAITECSTNQWDILKLLSGPNTIGVSYPEEKEMWGYLWLWGYQLGNPLGTTLILMDNPGKRIRKGKNPVELYLTFSENDMVERIEMLLIKAKAQSSYDY